MTNRRFTVLSLIAIAFAAFLLPADASAQSIWDRVRERARDEAQRDRDYGRDDRYGRRSGRISDYERRTLRDTARRLSNRSRDLQRDVDRLLDNSRYDDTRREDRVNDDVRRFRETADRFRDRAGDSNDLNRSAGEARQLLDAASRVSNYLRRLRLDSRTSNEWAQIRNDLRTISDIYGFRFRDFDDYGRDDDYDRRNRRRDNNSRWPY
ncbi:MAG TPA: hypothetical protein VM934_04110 [Pyrinomonadaceae bacterium]|jgi:hypothetical protein|nr:hypothetical protein [Pyrinomonadaceae bacterium]